MQKLKVAFLRSPNIWNILPWPVDSNQLIVVNLKWKLKYRGYLYLESVRPNVIYQIINYLQTHNKFYEGISILEDLSTKETITFQDIDKHQGVAESNYKIIISNETEYGWFEDPSSMYKTTSNEKALVSEIPYVANDENVIIALGQGKKSVLIWMMNFEKMNKKLSSS